jgi:dipeptide/tripeptide permease
MPAPGSGWRFPRAFWVANTIELFERAAYYGVFIALAVYLTDAAGFTDVEAGWVGAGFAALIYLLPFFTGAAADRMGFRISLIVSFACLTAGYASLGLLQQKPAVLVALVFAAFGGAIVKATIAGTVARCSDSATRARAFSIFYMMVNIGSFSGKTIAKPVRVELGVDRVPLYSAAAAAIALALVVFLFRPPEDAEARPRSARETFKGMLGALTRVRFLALILITAAFWMIQGQLYASMPKYVIRMVGAGASPEWYANVNPLVVVLLVVPITHLVRRLQPVTSIAIALGLIPLSALCMSLSPLLPGSVPVLGVALHPVTVMMVLGIALQGFGECFLSPRYLEYASKQAPPGQEGLYLGYAHLNIFFAWLAGFAVSGYLLEAFCPDPKTLPAAEQAQRLAALEGRGPMPAAYANAHHIWTVFALIGVTAFVLLLVFRAATSRRDRAAGAAEIPVSSGGPAR